MKHFVTLTAMRIRLTLRIKMFLFFSVIRPFGFFFLYSLVFAKGNPRGVLFVLGPVISLAVMGSFWGLSAALVTFREQGILRRFHVTPVTAADMLASSIVANYFLTLPTIVIELVLARVLFHVTDFGNLYSFFLLVTVGVVSFASMGLIVASVTNTMQETQVLNQLIWLPLIFLSGATMPLPFSPARRSKIRTLPPRHLFSLGTSSRHILRQRDHSRLDRSRFSRHLGRPRLLRRFPTLSLGARIQNPAQRKTLGRRHRHPLRHPRHLGKKTIKARCCCNPNPPTTKSNTPKNTTNPPCKNKHPHPPLTHKSSKNRSSPLNPLSALQRETAVEARFPKRPQPHQLLPANAWALAWNPAHSVL